MLFLLLGFLMFAVAVLPFVLVYVVHRLHQTQQRTILRLDGVARQNISDRDP